jgi:hypothetical protein
MPTLRRPTSGKLMCYANETLVLELMKWVNLEFGLDNLD